MIRQKDIPYILKMKELQGTDVTSDKIDRAVYEVNRETGMYYDANDVIKIMQFCGIIDIQTHLGQPRHGNIVNGGRVHTYEVHYG